MQKRDVTCETANNTEVDPKHCINEERPIQRKECYNEKCKGTWKVGEWSEVIIILLNSNLSPIDKYNSA